MADNLGITLAPPVSPQDIQTGGRQILAPADASSVGSPASSPGNDSSTNSDVNTLPAAAGGPGQQIQVQNSGSDSSWLLIVGAAIVLALIFIPGKKKR